MKDLFTPLATIQKVAVPATLDARMERIFAQKKTETASLQWVWLAAAVAVMIVGANFFVVYAYHKDNQPALTEVFSLQRSHLIAYE